MNTCVILVVVAFFFNLDICIAVENYFYFIIIVVILIIKMTILNQCLVGSKLVCFCLPTQTFSIILLS